MLHLGDYCSSAPCESCRCRHRRRDGHPWCSCLSRFVAVRRRFGDHLPSSRSDPGPNTIAEVLLERALMQQLGQLLLTERVRHFLVCGIFALGLGQFLLVVVDAWTRHLNLLHRMACGARGYHARRCSLAVGLPLRLAVGSLHRLHSAQLSRVTLLQTFV